MSARGIEVDVVGMIGGNGVSAATVATALKRDPEAPVLVNINSTGGNPHQALAIYDMLRSRSSRVSVSITAVAASAATIICAAGDDGHVAIAENAYFMIHLPSISMLSGEASNLRQMADLLDKITDQMATIYARRTRRAKAKILEEMANESWFTAAEALERGFVDTITPARKVAAALDLSAFRNVPAPLRETEVRTMERRFDEYSRAELHAMACDDRAAFDRLYAAHKEREEAIAAEPWRFKAYADMDYVEKTTLAQHDRALFDKARANPTARIEP